MFSGNYALGQVPEQKTESKGLLYDIFDLASKGYGMILASKQQKREAELRKLQIQAPLEIAKAQAQAAAVRPVPIVYGGGEIPWVPIILGVGVLGTVVYFMKG